MALIKSIYIILLTQITYIASCPSIDYMYHGDATAFGGTNNGGMCGFKESSFSTSNYINKIEVALNYQQWNNSLNCGRCVEIKYNNTTINALISNQCPECKYGDLDLFEESYSKLIKELPGRKKIEWNYIPCYDFVTGNINLRVDHVNRYWLSINPENFLCGIHSIEILFLNIPNSQQLAPAGVSEPSEWIQLERNDQIMNGLYFNYNGFVHVPFQLRITSINNEQKITQPYNDITNNLETNFQFKC